MNNESSITLETTQEALEILERQDGPGMTRWLDVRETQGDLNEFYFICELDDRVAPESHHAFRRHMAEQIHFGVLGDSL